MKTKLLSVLTLLFTTLGFTQIGFQDHFINDASNYTVQPKFANASDLDGDGDKDILVTGNGSIGWHENVDEFVTYSPRKLIYSGSSSTIIYSLIVFDIDLDGDMDVLSSISGIIYLFENIDGQGNFGYKQYIAGGGGIFTSDIDGDGDLDILKSQNSQMSWLENIDGFGTFGNSPNLIASVGFSVYAKGDLDSDGDIDVLSISSDGKIIWFENLDGLGNFGNQQAIITSLENHGHLYVSDMDGDGDMDLVAGSYSDNIIVWYENLDGLGNFGNPQTITTNVDSTRDILVDDIDGDGDGDVLTASYNDDTIAWYENTNGLGSFGSIQIISTNANGAYSVYATDIDNDGDLDVVSASTNDAKITWYKNTDGLGDFESGIVITHLRSRDIESVFAEDIDGDGDMDVISASNNVDGVFWHKNIDEQGTFSVPILISSDATNVSSIYVSDLDYDGDMDVLIASRGNDNIVWFENLDGNGIFGEQQVIASSSNPSSIFVADIDGDGFNDVIYNSYTNGTVRWIKNEDGQGVFTYGDGVGGIYANTSVYVSDLDSDGDMDILSASSIDSQIVWIENMDGLGNMGNKLVISDLVDNPLFVYASDIDGDGDIDVLSASQDDDVVAWYENDGLGSFGVQQVISSNANGVNTVKTSDIDGDGDLDVFSANQYDDKIVWYENLDGLGTFGSEQIVTLEVNSVKTVFASDIDADGDMDFISPISITVGSNISESIKWYENSGVIWNKINGIFRYDVNNDGCTSSDYPASGILVSTEGNSSSFSTFTTESGIFQFFPEEGTYSTTIQSLLPTYYDVDPISHVSNFSGIGNVDVVNFCFTSNQNIDEININVYPTLNSPRPGFDTTYQLVYNNVGTTQLSGSVTFEFDDAKIQFLNASESVSLQTANTLTFDFVDLNPFDTRTIDLNFNVFAPPTTEIGDILTSTATVNPVVGDETEEDNVFTLEQTVIGSYDPNDIQVLEGDQILLADAGKYLHYIIRFQNTGTASAINVNVENILDDKLDWTTMQLESLSHTGRVEITNGTNVDFIFDDINLSDSTTDEPNSHGFIAYKIKPKNDVVVGDIIYNTADIFFDFNPAITTNTVSTEIVEALSVNEFNSNGFSVYPNPTSNTLTIVGKDFFESITVYDINGRMLKTVGLPDPKTEFQIDVEDLSNGIYFIEIQTGSAKSIQKFIKK